MGMPRFISECSSPKGEEMKSTQTKLIQKHLEDGKSITPIDALQLFGCFRLSARIHDLKKEGMNIITRNTRAGEKQFASYELAGA